MVDHALALPWERYKNYDMVVWGVRERVEEGEMEGVSSLLSTYGRVTAARCHFSCDSRIACHTVDAVYMVSCKRVPVAIS